MVSTFYAGVAALDADDLMHARTLLKRATELVPEEPAAWANLGLLKVREGDCEVGCELEVAAKLLPGDPQIEQLLGLMESRKDRFTEAVAHLRAAVDRAPMT